MQAPRRFLRSHTADWGIGAPGSRNFTRRPLCNAELPSITAQYVQ